MLALRLMPSGSRRFKTSWWRGFTEGIVKKLVQENRVMVKESHGAGLVLLERSERAYQAMHAFEPNLQRSFSYRLVGVSAMEIWRSKRSICRCL